MTFKIRKIIGPIRYNIDEIAAQAQPCTASRQQYHKTKPTREGGNYSDVLPLKVAPT